MREPAFRRGWRHYLAWESRSGVLGAITPRGNRPSDIGGAITARGNRLSDVPKAITPRGNAKSTQVEPLRRFLAAFPPDRRSRGAAGQTLERNFSPPGRSG